MLPPGPGGYTEHAVLGQAGWPQWNRTQSQQTPRRLHEVSVHGQTERLRSRLGQLRWRPMGKSRFSAWRGVFMQPVGLRLFA